MILCIRTKTLFITVNFFLSNTFICLSLFLSFFNPTFLGCQINLDSKLMDWIQSTNCHAHSVMPNNRFIIQIQPMKFIDSTEQQALSRPSYLLQKHQLSDQISQIHVHSLSLVSSLLCRRNHHLTSNTDRYSKLFPRMPACCICKIWKHR